MKQTILETNNPYERAFHAQSEIAVINREIKELNGKKNRLEETYKDAIAQGELTGKAKIGGFSLIIERKTTENRHIILSEIKEHMPDLLRMEGKLPAALYTKYMSKKQFEKLINDKNFDNEYALTLGALDKATGSIKKSKPFVDIEITERLEKSISVIRQPIIEV